MNEFAAILKRAADQIGIDKLRLGLGVTREALKAWIEGRARTPLAIFLSTVDIVEQHTTRVQLATSLERLLREARELVTIAARFSTVRLRTARHAVKNNSARLLPDRTLTLLEPAFVATALHGLLDEALYSALAAAGTNLANLQLVSPEGSLHIVAHHGFNAQFLDFFSTAAGKDSASGLAMRERKQILIPDVRSSRLFAGTPAGDAMLQAGSEAVESTPIIDEPTGTLMGIISTHHRTPGNATTDELALLEAIAAQTASWLEPAPNVGEASQALELMEPPDRTARQNQLPS
jgi:GAF domain-containing protein